MKSKMFAAVVGTTLVLASALADSWSPFHSIGYSVSVSQTIVQHSKKDGDMWAFKFHNDGTRAVRGDIIYHVTDTDGRSKEVRDILLKLKPGETFGGWAAYSCTSRTTPSVTLKNVEYSK